MSPRDWPSSQETKGTKMIIFGPVEVVALDEILEAADKVFASSGLGHELAVMELRAAVTTFRTQQATWAKDTQAELRTRRFQSNG